MATVSDVKTSRRQIVMLMELVWLDIIIFIELDPQLVFFTWGLVSNKAKLSKWRPLLLRTPVYFS